jgi:CBS domain containing-hemolysin-like protein
VGQVARPIAEHVAHVFAKAIDGTFSATTPLTSRRHRVAQAVVRARKASAKAAATSSTTLQKPMSTNALPLCTCLNCGGTVTGA